MEYELLSKLYYKNREIYNQTYIKRLESESSYVLDFFVYGNQAFFVTTVEMLWLVEGIMGLSSDIKNLYNMIPGVARERFVNECLLQEVMLTNDIEGVHSSRKEVAYAMQNKDNKKVRFSGLVNKYYMLLGDKDIPLDTCRDIRNLYDEIVLNEIDKTDIPDGKYFRKGSVSVVSATDKEKHRGVSPENEIINYMDKALKVLKDKSLPVLIKIAVFHYLFGYIHPFYDGNGRMSRFISSYLLGGGIEKIIALRLSYSLKNRKNDYYKAFDLCNEKINKGDITPFIYMFLDALRETEVSLCESLNEYLERISYYLSILERVKFKKEWHKNLVWGLVQTTIFSENGMSMQELIEFLQKSDLTIRRGIEELVSGGIPILHQKVSKKLIYNIDLEKFEKTM